ncbi:sensor histidine kinase [Fastidiosibacter lacustris]|uniref:sensor histidine kinase n=1 Tax=Fastidiosibacter lacustris TaxID=2056695 RepID=UPI000E3574BD|nr:HAMP domain-containing sensor histidine kinase [Fastidiosibacter lacustris]
MNIDLRKVIRSQKKAFHIGLTCAMFLISIQFLATSYYVYTGAQYQRSAKIKNYDPTQSNEMSTLSFFDLSNLQNIDDAHIHDRFAFYSKTPSCTEVDIASLLLKVEKPIHRCESYLNANGTWLNIIYYSKFQLNTPVSMVFGIVVVVLFLFIFIFFIQIKWSIPFFEFQRFAQDMGLRLHAAPLQMKNNIFTQEVADTFNFMQNRINHVLTYQNKLLAMTCHDIRTPLTRIQARRLQEHNELSTKDQKDIQEINNMLDDLVLFSKENWLSGIQFELTNICDFFDELVCEYLDSQKNVRLINKTNDDIELELKKPAFKRAINNIVNNGLKHGSEVIITLQLQSLSNLINQKKTLLIIDILDNGPGIPETEIKKVFAPFYTGSSAKKGNGLGLAITKEIIDIHQGKIEITNASHGGLNVRIIL